MEFLEFRISNYKGIKSVVFKLKSGINIYSFVGLNESGKTTVLEAINTFAHPLPKEERHTLIPKSEKHSFKGTIEIGAKLQLSAWDRDEIIKFVRVKGYEQVFIGEKIEINRKYKFINSKYADGTHYWTIGLEVRKKGWRGKRNLIDENNKVWQETISFIEAHLFPKVIYYPNFLFDFPERIYLDPIEGETLEFIKYRDIVQDILSSIDPALDLKNDILERLKSPGDENNELIGLLLNKMSSAVSEKVFTAWEKLFKRNDKEIKITNGSAIVDGKVFHYLQFKLKEKDSLFSISERSLGFKWFFSFLLFTEFRKNRTSEKSRVLFLLDEPASNLHPSAQTNLLKTFEDLVDKSILLYTTHSHYLINPEWLNGVYIVKNRALSSNEDISEMTNTDIEITEYKKFVASYPTQKEYFQPILDTLDYQPGLLERIPSVVIVEGKNDFYTFRYLLRLFFNDEYKLHFYPSAGATSDESLIRMYEAWNRQYIVLKDDDNAGKKAIEKYLSVMPFIKDKAFTIADIIPEAKGFSLEDLFSEDERLAITKVARGKATVYKKEDFNLGIQFLLFENKKIELSEETISSFQKIFVFLASELI